VDLFLGKTASDFCPVSAMLCYLGLLFGFSELRYLSRVRLVMAIRSKLQKAGFDYTKYCRHNFRIRAATTAASRGMKDAVIKTLGRWKSLAYLEYVKIP